LGPEDNDKKPNYIRTTLPDRGYLSLGLPMNPFNDFPHSDFQIVAPDGMVRASARGIFSGKQVTVFDSALIVFAGDEIRRKLPNGSEEAFEVVDPKFFDDFHGIPANFQIDVRRKGVFEAGKGGNYSILVSGQNARVNVHSTDHSTNVASGGDIFGGLATAIQKGVQDENSRLAIIQAIALMKERQGKSGFHEAYRNFMSLAADHLGVILPFLPALAGMLPG
jgi:hypothetical protein